MKEGNYCLMLLVLTLVFFFIFSLIPLVIIGVAIDVFSFFLILGSSLGMGIIILEFLIEDIAEYIKGSE